MLPLYWAIAAAAAGAGFGAVSAIVSARRLYFLAGGMPHAALVAVMAGIVAARLLGGAVYGWAVVFATLFSLIAWLLLRLGVDPERAAAVYVAFSSSFAVLLAYYVLTNVPVHVSLWAYVLGDPLLISLGDVAAVLAASALLVALVALVYKGVVVVALDTGFAESVGLRVWLYDLAAVTLLAAVSAFFLRVTGFVLEHVLILVPGIIAARVSGSARAALRSSIIISMASSLAGLGVGCMLDVSPSGAAGLILALVYVASLLRVGGAGSH